MNAVKRKIKVVKNRDVLYQETHDNCSSDTETLVEWEKSFERDAELEVSTNNSRTLNLATDLAIGVKDVIGAKSALSTSNVSGDGRKITTTDKIKYLVKVKKGVNEYSRMKIAILTKSDTATNAGLTQTVVGHWTDAGNNDRMDSCMVTITGTGSGAEREYTYKYMSHPCHVPVCPTIPTGPG